MAGAQAELFRTGGKYLVSGIYVGLAGYLIGLAVLIFVYGSDPYDPKAIIAMMSLIVIGILIIRLGFSSNDNSEAVT